jgi:hypothetical protein
MTIEFAENDIRTAFAGVTFDAPASRIISRAKRRRHRRRVAFGAIPVIGVFAAGGYVVTHREVTTPGALACAASFSQTGDMTIIGRVDGETPEETCLRVMKETGQWLPAPNNPVRCVTNHPNGDGGALLVVPAPEDMTQEQACAALGAALPPEDSP